MNRNQPSAISNQLATDRAARRWRDSWRLIAGCGLLLSTTGCISRSLTIKTEPPGALVYVNDDLKGTSPVTYDFMWYGWHRVTLRKEGYERLEDRRLLRAPIHFWIPFDLAMELLPFPIRDRRTWQYPLTPAAVPPAPVPPELLGEAAPPSPQPKTEAGEAAPDSEATP